jgi:hypothetical protein
MAWLLLHPQPASVFLASHHLHKVCALTKSRGNSLVQQQAFAHDCM